MSRISTKGWNDIELIGDETFGHKFIGVKEGGKLEIHGKDKVSWTRLNDEVSPKPKIFSTEEDQPRNVGLAIYGFNQKTGINSFSKDGIVKKKHLEQGLDKLQILSSDLVVIVNR